MNNERVVIIGAGPAGLTAAYQLVKAGRRPVVLEADSVVGGISRTVERNGWRFDIGGHRFFTKVDVVEQLWNEILPEQDWMLRPRSSRIFYKRRFFDYPLRALNAFTNLGVLETMRCLGSYAWVRVRPPQDQTTFEGWVASRFGWRLYRTFFKTYTEKVWGVKATELSADWAAQRIKNLSLLAAVADALRLRRNKAQITSLITEFRYPKHGPGMLWERCADHVVAGGGSVEFSQPVSQIRWEVGRGAVEVVTAPTGNGSATAAYPAEHVISSMPINELVLSMDPPAPPDVQQAARDLHHRDFLTVALVLPDTVGFPDNWIYIHEPGVKVGRIQNFRSWSPHMVKPGFTCLGLEYFVFEGDELWSMDDADLVVLASRELAHLGLAKLEEVTEGYVVRMPKAYPTYDDVYATNVDVIRQWLSANVPNVYPVGRNGMHRYNNQDHSMYTAMLTAENLVSGTSHDVWSVNVEDDYHEIKSPSSGTGRDAPVVPRRS